MLEFFSLSGECLHPEFPERTEASGLPHDLGGCFSSISDGTGREEGRHCLRRHECGTSGNRFEESKEQPQKCRIYR